MLYSEVIADPIAAASTIANLIDPDRPTPLNQQAMAAAVDPTLYRNRLNES